MAKLENDVKALEADKVDREAVLRASQLKMQNLRNKVIEETNEVHKLAGAAHQWKDETNKLRKEARSSAEEIRSLLSHNKQLEESNQVLTDAPPRAEERLELIRPR